MSHMFAVLLAVPLLLATALQSDVGRTTVEGIALTPRSIEGSVRIRGSQIQGLLVRTSGSTQRPVLTDSAGGFRIDELQRGGSVLEVYYALSRGYSRMGQMRLDSAPETAPIVLNLDPVRLDVLLTWPTGAVGWGMRVEIKSIGTEAEVERTVSWAVTDENGRATLAVPTTGPYRVTARHGSWGRGAVLLDLERDREEALTIPIRLVVPCAGKVLVPGPRANRARRLFFQNLDDGPNSVPEEIISTQLAWNSDEFVCLNTIPGRYIARLFDPVDGVRHSRPFEITESGSKELVLEFGEER